MPIPKRRPGESKADFLKRGHEALADEFPDPKQRHAILMRQISKAAVDALNEGTSVEMEHTADRDVARKIALDHLREDPYYYVKLRSLEKGLGGPDGSHCDGEVAAGANVRKALDGVKRMIRVANAAMPEGTVMHRKDGDWKKAGGAWVRLPISNG